MANRAVAAVRIGEEDHVALFNLVIIALQEAIDETAELANDHLAGPVGDQGKGVALFANAGRHGGTYERSVHLDPCIAQGILDDIQCDRVDIDRFEGRGIGFDNPCRHGRTPKTG